MDNRDNSFWEDNERGSLNEQLIALSASYQALARYIAGADIYLMPRNINDLHEKLCVPLSSHVLANQC